MTHTYSIKKIHTGEIFTDENEKSFILMGSTGWAVVNEMGQVHHFSSAKYIAQIDADELNQ
jgi:hypothetical protein